MCLVSLFFAELACGGGLSNIENLDSFREDGRLALHYVIMWYMAKKLIMEIVARPLHCDKPCNYHLALLPRGRIFVI